MSASHALLRTIAVTIVALVLLDLTKPITAPVVLALVVGVVLSPLIDRAARHRVPAAAAAAAATIATFGLMVGGIAILAPAVEDAFRAIPRAVDDMRDTIGGILAFRRDIERVSDEVGAALGAQSGSAGGASAEPLPGPMDALLYAPQVAGQALVFLGTLFFYLLTRPEIHDWIACVAAHTGRRTDVLRLIRSADRSVSRYFATITAINALLGVAVTIALAALGMPSPATWGLVAFLLNFLLYLGPGAFIVALLVAGHVQFDGLKSYAPAALFALFNFIEAYVMTPSLVGHRLAINPLVIFLTLTAGIGLWGMIGGIVALPLLVWVLTVSGLISWREDSPAPSAPDPATKADRP